MNPILLTDFLIPLQHLSLPLAQADFADPRFWALLVLFIFTVVLHEFAHGFVGYKGGDFTVRDRGLLTLNPVKYIDPFGSIVLPAIFLLIGGIPLPGAATYVDRSLLRSKWWDSAVSAAGPAANAVIFFALLLPMHPDLGLVDLSRAQAASPVVQVLAALVVLEGFLVLLNLLPVPPLDGFGIIAPHLDPQARMALLQPQVRTPLLIGLFALLIFTPLGDWLLLVVLRTIDAVGFGSRGVLFFLECFDLVLFDG